MGTGCTKCCGKIQDWCRDSCGCCPCKFCKTKKVEVKTHKANEFKVGKKETPYGYGLIHAGVRTADNTHTSPVLEIRTWRKSMTHATMNETTEHQRIALGGMQTDRDNADHHIGPSRGKKQRTMELDEDIIVIPIESIISIKCSAEIKKGQTEYKNVRLKTPTSPVELTCCGKLSQWCNKTFCCCCCCDDSKNKVQIMPEQIMTTVSDRKAERKISIIIEHVRYSNIDTPSHLHVLNTADQSAFYKENLYKDTLKFYLLDNYDFEQADFDLKLDQAATLCRLVTQLKAMVKYYPDQPALEKIMGKQDNLRIGEPPRETIE